jgi:hypothetical protein
MLGKIKQESRLQGVSVGLLRSPFFSQEIWAEFFNKNLQLDMLENIFNFSF